MVFFSPERPDTIVHSFEVTTTGGRIEALSNSRGVPLDLTDALPKFIGRSPRSALVLNEGSVSRIHLEVTATHAGICLVNRGRSGSYLQGARFDTVYVTEPTVVRLGRREFVRVTPTTPVRRVDACTPRMGRLVGVEPAMQLLFQSIRSLSTSDLPILIHGETGTGKDVLARTIHEEGPRHRKPFRAVNCSAIPENMIDAELFGYERGAFTGATHEHKGLFEEADGGTLFLDEIALATPALQQKLLRVVEDQEIRPLGSRAPKKVATRLIAATNADLWKAVQDGHFREDLFFRLSTIQLNLPPLRERRQDIPFLIHDLVKELSPCEVVVDKKTLAILQGRPWHGNIRELRNILCRALQMHPPGAGGVLVLDDALARIPVRPWKEIEEKTRDEYMATLLAECDGNVSRMSRQAEQSRKWVKAHLPERAEPRHPVERDRLDHSGEHTEE